MMGATGAGALKAYNKAIEIRRDAAAKANGGATTAPLSARLLNNAAVLHLRAGESEEALRLMGQAVAAAASGGLGDLSAVAQVGSRRLLCLSVVVKPAP
jgi:tetratricopeptide (TPR) repeat protein